MGGATRTSLRYRCLVVAAAVLAGLVVLPAPAGAVGPPVVIVTPGVVSAGGTITATGDGYNPNEVLKLSLINSAGSFIQSTTVTADGSGRFSRTGAIPGSVAPGAYGVVTHVLASGTLRAQTIFLVSVPLPAAPAVIVFRGGLNKFDGTGWGGAGDAYQGICEGLARQATGLLDPLGKPGAVPAPQQLPVNSGANAVGFSGNGYRAYNMDASTFRTAFAALQQNDRLYVCTHGFFDDMKRKGGVIELDQGTAFNGFASATFAEGTKARGVIPAYGEGNVMPAAPGNVQAIIHACFSGRDPDQANGGEEAVSTTLLKVGGITAVPLAAGDTRGPSDITRSHQHEALNAVMTTAAAAAGKSPTTGDIASAQSTLRNAANLVKLRNTAQQQQYAIAQGMINAALGAGKADAVVARMVYGDTGEGNDPPAASLGPGVLSPPGPVPGCAPECSGPCPAATPPACSAPALINGPPKQLKVTIQDSDAGLQSIDVVESQNTSVDIPAFDYGDTDPIVVTGTKVNQSLPSRLTVVVTDMQDRQVTCDPILVTVAKGGPKSEKKVVLHNVSGNEGLISVQNGVPGLQWLKIVVNGHVQHLRRLQDGDVRTLDVYRHLVPGDGNTIKLRAEGKVQGTATVLIHD